MKNVRSLAIILAMAFVAITGWMFLPGAALADDGGSKPTLKLQQFSLGAPDGDPEGNLFFAGSTQTYLDRLDEILAGAKFKQKSYVPVEASVWGPGGQFGGELYFLAVVSRLPKDSLLREQKAVRYRFHG